MRLLNGQFLQECKKILIERLDRSSTLKTKNFYLAKNKCLDILITRAEREEFNKKKLYLGKIVFEYNYVYLDNVVIYTFFKPVMVNQLSTQIEEKRFKSMLSLFSVSWDLPSAITIIIFVLSGLVWVISQLRYVYNLYQLDNFGTQLGSLITSGHISFLN